MGGRRNSPGDVSSACTMMDFKRGPEATTSWGNMHHGWPCGARQSLRGVMFDKAEGVLDPWRHSNRVLFIQ